MKNYLVYYRKRGIKTAEVFETSVTAYNAEHARRIVELSKEYIIVKVRREI